MVARLLMGQTETQREGRGRNPEMNDREKSHGPVVPTKLRNKAAKAGADGVEGRGPTKGNLIGKTRTGLRAGATRKARSSGYVKQHAGTSG